MQQVVLLAGDYNYEFAFAAYERLSNGGVVVQDVLQLEQRLNYTFESDPDIVMPHICRWVATATAAATPVLVVINFPPRASLLPIFNHCSKASVVRCIWAAAPLNALPGQSNNEVPAHFETLLCSRSGPTPLALQRWLACLACCGTIVAPAPLQAQTTQEEQDVQAQEKQTTTTTARKLPGEDDLWSMPTPMEGEMHHQQMLPQYIC